jgi:hypothetical protein
MLRNFNAKRVGHIGLCNAEHYQLYRRCLCMLGVEIIINNINLLKKMIVLYAMYITMALPSAFCCEVSILYIHMICVHIIYVSLCNIYRLQFNLQLILAVHIT